MFGDSRLQTSERLYYSDSFLKTFTGAVTEARQVTGSSAEMRWQLALDRTAFYPTSGGQPFDTGQLSAISPDGTALHVPVEQVEEDERGELWHLVHTPLAVGAQVEGTVDWERRFDHMQQHSGQHLLSAVFWRELQAPTISFHLGDRTSTIDLAGGLPPHHDLQRVECIANEIIGEDRQVTTLNVSRAEAEAMLAAGQLRKLPDVQDKLRLIEIADCDKNACGGTHVRSTGQIGGLQLRTVEKVTRGVRIEFVCGLRAVRAAGADLAILRKTSGLLSTGAQDLALTVGRLLTEAKTSARERQKLREELAIFQAAKLASEAPMEDGLRLVVGAWKDRDRDYVKLLASRTAMAATRTAVIFCANDADPARVFIARSADLDFNCGQILREALAHLGLRGGGSADLAQGDIPAQQVSALQSSLIDSIRRQATEDGKQQ
jgi:alanyl-tRNA synthetase